MRETETGSENQRLRQTKAETERETEINVGKDGDREIGRETRGTR